MKNWPPPMRNLVTLLMDVYHSKKQSHAFMPHTLPKTSNYLLGEPGAHLAQWLSHIGGGTARYFVCRHIGCSPPGPFVGPHTSWAYEDTARGWKFYCPKCGYLYQVHRTGPHYVKAHFLWCFP